MKYRYLEQEERKKVEFVFEKMNCEIPSEMRIFVGENDSQKIISFQCLHQVWHAGPVWIDPEYRKRGLWEPMQIALENTLPVGFGFYQFATAENESQLRRLGLHPMGWEVWAKRVNR